MWGYIISQIYQILSQAPSILSFASYHENPILRGKNFNSWRTPEFSGNILWEYLQHELDKVSTKFHDFWGWFESVLNFQRKFSDKSCLWSNIYLLFLGSFSRDFFLMIVFFWRLFGWGFPFSRLCLEARFWSKTLVNYRHVNFSNPTLNWS